MGIGDWGLGIGDCGLGVWANRQTPNALHHTPNPHYLFNSMGEEFTWEYIRTAILANVSMIDKMAIVALIQTANKLKEEKKQFNYVIVLILIKFIFNNFGYTYLPYLKFGGDQWKILISKIVTTLLFALLAKKIFKNQHKTVEELAEEEYIK